MITNDQKNYIVLAELGHCGQGYFIPVLFPVKASSIEEAKQLAREIPRVKHDKKHAIIFCKECTYHERKIIRYLNDFDNFLTSDIKNGANEEIRQRRIRTPLYIQDLEKTLRKSNDQKIMEEYLNIKTADKFPHDMILQRYCAPIDNNGRLLFRKINIQDMLKEYFEAKTNEILHTEIPEPDQHASDYISQKEKYDKLQNSREKIIKHYFYLYGPKNSLGIKYDVSNHTLSHPALKTTIEMLYNENEIPIYADKQEEIDPSFDDTTTHRPSQIDKFNARLAKTAELKK